MYVKGYLDTHTAPDLENAFRQLVDVGKYSIVVNLKELKYISSAGLGVLLGFVEDIRSNGGDIKLANMPAKIYRVFDLLGFHALYDIVDSESQAVAKFHSHWDETAMRSSKSLKTSRDSTNSLAENRDEILNHHAEPVGESFYHSQAQAGGETYGQVGLRYPLYERDLN